MPDAYHNMERNLTVQKGDSGWFYYGDGVNSLCMQPPLVFADHVTAMQAAEQEQDRRDSQ